jgi:hypothetical protein
MRLQGQVLLPRRSTESVTVVVVGQLRLNASRLEGTTSGAIGLRVQPSNRADLDLANDRGIETEITATVTRVETGGPLTVMTVPQIGETATATTTIEIMVVIETTLEVALTMATTEDGTEIEIGIETEIAATPPIDGTMTVIAIGDPAGLRACGRTLQQRRRGIRGHRLAAQVSRSQNHLAPTSHMQIVYYV